MTRYALSWSGGKDSTLALDRAVREGLDVACLFNIYEGISGRVRFHGVPAGLIAAQADALGIPLLQDATHPDDYETVFVRVLDRLKTDGIEGVIFGNIHLADIRAWYEERTVGRGFKHVEPLWGDPPLSLVHEVVDRGYVPRMVSIDLARTPREWLGRMLDHGLLDEIAAHPEIDPCGERGEYHTFVQSGPLFREALRIKVGEEIEMEGHGLIDLSAADVVMGRRRNLTVDATIAADERRILPDGLSISPLTEAEWPTVRRIYEQGIATRNATFETEVPAWERWDGAHLAHSRLCAWMDGEVAGWAALSAVSDRCVYSGVAENSIYIDEAVRGRGIGRALLTALIRSAEEHGIWTVQTGIFPENQASVTLHIRCGFRVVGTRERVGRLDGRWRDVLYLERRSRVVGND